MNLNKEIRQRRNRNKTIRDLLEKKFPKALDQSQMITESKAVGNFLHVVNYSVLGNSWGLNRFYKSDLETDKELKRLFEILNYGDSIDEMERLVKELKSIIKQGKAKGFASVDMTDLSVWYGDVTITKEKWWFDVLEKTFFGK